MDIALIFFSAGEKRTSLHLNDPYDFVLRLGDFADREGLRTVFIPERHFTDEGALFPNPAVVQAALARTTKRVRLYAGSVVAPLHHPVRIAEEWSVVDRLSNGRAGICFASGWSPDDFLFAADAYSDRRAVLEQHVDVVRRLWRGETVPVMGVGGKTIDVRSLPRPIQRELPFGLTAAGSPNTFRLAGKLGGEILTHTFNMGAEEIRGRVAEYRQGRAEAGLDPAGGRVTVMMHSAVHHDGAVARDVGGKALHSYLTSATHLLSAIATSRGQKVDLHQLSSHALSEYCDVILERMIECRRVLFGSPAECADVLVDYRDAGVDQVALQVDFGVPENQVLEQLSSLAKLRTLATKMEHTAVSSISRPTAPARDRSESLAMAEVECSKPFDSDDFYIQLHELGVDLGESQRALSAITTGEGSALATCLLEGATDPTARMIDACLHTLTAGELAAVQGAGQLTLPHRFSNLALAKVPNTKVVKVHAWTHRQLADRGLLGSARVYEPDGTLVMSLDDLEFADFVPTTKSTRELCSVVDWIPAPTSDGGNPQRGWIVFGDDSKFSSALSDRCRRDNTTCFIVTQGERFERRADNRISLNCGDTEQLTELFELVGRETYADDVKATFEIVLQASALSANGVSAENAFEHLVQKEVGDLLSLAKVMIASRPGRLWVATQGALRLALDAPKNDGVLQSALWGLGRTLGHEHPEIWGGLVDLEAGADADTSAHLLVSHVCSEDEETDVAFRNDMRHAARIRNISSDNLVGQTWTWRSDRSYVVTGGTGDLGLALAEHAVEHGARHLILLGRRPVALRDHSNSAEPSRLNARLRRIVHRLERFGATIQFGAVDVSDREALQRFFAEYSGPPVHGAFHLAGVSVGTTVQHISVEDFAAVFRPKILGAINLNEVLAEHPLEIFVSFSSPAAVLGLYGQGGSNYAAANSFLDSFASHTATKALTSISLAWGPWDTIGLAARSGQLARMARSGIGSMAPEHALNLLDGLLTQASPHVLIMDTDWERYATNVPRVRAVPLLQAVMNSTGTATGGLQLRASLGAVPTSEREGIVAGYMSVAVARILGASVESLSSTLPLLDLGVDSIMAVELRSSVERDLGIELPFSDLMNGATLTELVSVILATWSSGETEDSLDEDSDERLLDQFEHLSVEMLEQMIGADRNQPNE